MSTKVIEIRNGILNGIENGIDVNGDNLSDIEDVMAYKLSSYGGINFSSVYAGEIMYIIYTFSFYDSNGDGTGDFPGIIEKMEYIKSLGVTTVVLRCIFELTDAIDQFQEEKTDMSKLNPKYGTMEDFENLVKAFHDNGIKVLLQNEFQRVYRKHNWILASEDVNHPEHEKYKDFVKWTSNPPTVSRNGSVRYNSTRDAYYFAKDSAFAVYLNIENQDVVDEIYNILVGWINKGIDGFYFTDVGFLIHNYELNEEGTIVNVTTDINKNTDIWSVLIKRMRDVNENLEFHADFGRTPMSAENFAPSTIIDTIKYLRAGFNNISGNDAIYALYEFKALTLSALYTQYAAYNIQNSFIFSSTDLIYLTGSRYRLFEKNESDESKLVFLRALMTLPGIPTYIHGDELGYHKTSISRDGLFPVMNWTDEAPLYGFSTNPDTQNIDESQPTVPNNNILKGFKQLVKLRRLNRAFTLSKAFMMTSDNDVLIFQVQKTDRTYICAHNFSDKGKSIRICNEKVNNNPEVNFFEFITMANTTIPIDDGEYYLFDLLNNITMDILTVENGVYEYNTTLSRYGSLVAKLIKV